VKASGPLGLQDFEAMAAAGTGAAEFWPMQLNHSLPRTVVPPRTYLEKQLPKGITHVEFGMTNYVVDEINAYAAIRDIALAEAEKVTTQVNLERVRIANEFVEHCLKPARPLYENQHLPEADAVRERGRCQAVKVRLSLLRAHMEALSREHAHAA
jgi:hypothetical protein